ncbi:MAG: MBL fold metallo-hydrolase [Longimicrobiales bacterium]
MRLTFLGTGTSFGVPVVGCDCETCTSDDPRDRRTRHGAVVNLGETNVLVDTPPELRLQLLDAGIDRVNAVWYTHDHGDHVHGIDDLRAFTVRGQADLPAYVPEEFETVFRERFRYVFDRQIHAPRGSSKPEVEMRVFGPDRPVDLFGHSFTPLVVPHGHINAYGFRVGDLGYVTDGKLLPPATMAALDGVKVLVLNALWFGKPHPTHFNVEEAVEAAQAVGAERTYLTHLTHRVRHQELLDRLPGGIEPAYDGLTVDIP